MRHNILESLNFQFRYLSYNQHLHYVSELAHIVRNKKAEPNDNTNVKFIYK